MKRFILYTLAGLGVLALIVGGFIFYTISSVDYKYTGEQLFDAVNIHREAVGVGKLELDSVLCDNLVERWEAIKNPGNAHKGYEEWLKAEGISDNPKYGVIGEMYVKDISTPENAIAWWVGSPGHKSTLEMKDLVYGCAYANDGTGVVIVATKPQEVVKQQ